MPFAMPSLDRPASASLRIALGNLFAEYLVGTRVPLTNLVFVFPLVALYEFASLTISQSAEPDRELVAQHLIRGAFSWIGLGGSWLAGLLLLTTLVLWHARTGRPWVVRPLIPLLMIVESALWTVPLVVLHQALLQAGGPHGDGRNRVLQTLGAGLYEELIFRLILVGGLLWFTSSLLNIRRNRAVMLAICVGALLFSGCHFQPIGAEAFSTPTFLHRVAAGAFLGWVFVQRGIGVACGAHILHNITVLAISPAPVPG